jgi:hypothetical protein
VAGESAGATNWRLFQILVIVLAINAAYRTVIPGPYALPGPTVAWMSIGFTLLMGIGVAGMGLQLSRDAGLAESRRQAVKPLMLLGLAACAALLLYRVLSVPGFYHGHLMNTPMSPR